MADITIDTLEISIEKKSSQAAEEVRALANAFRSLRSSISGELTKSLKDVAEAIFDISTAIDAIDTSKLENLADSLKKTADAAKDIKKIGKGGTSSSGLPPFTDNGRKTAPGTYVPNWTQYKPKIAGLLNPSPQPKGDINTSDYTYKEARRRAFNARADWADPHSRFGQAPGFHFTTFGDKVKATITEFKANAAKTLSPKNLGFMFLRRVLYRVMNAIISAISNYAKTALSAYANSGSYSDSKVFDRLATAMQQIGNVIAQVIVPILKVIEPITTAIGAIVATIGNVFSFLVAKLTMASEMMYTDISAIKDSSLKTSQSVQSFDRLNVLSQSNDSLMENIKTNEFLARQAGDITKFYLGKALDLFTKIRDEVGQIPIIGKWLQGLMDGLDVGGFFDEINEKIDGIVKIIADPLGYIKERFPAVAEFIQSINDTIYNILKFLTDRFTGIFKKFSLESKVGKYLAQSTPGLQTYPNGNAIPAAPYFLPTASSGGFSYDDFATALVSAMESSGTAQGERLISVSVNLDGREIKSSIDNITYRDGTQIKTGGASI